MFLMFLRHVKFYIFKSDIIGYLFAIWLIIFSMHKLRLQKLENANIKDKK